MKLKMIVQDWRDIQTGESKFFINGSADKIEAKIEFSSIHPGQVVECEVEFENKETENQLREILNQGTTPMFSAFLGEGEKTVKIDNGE